MKIIDGRKSARVRTLTVLRVSHYENGSVVVIGSNSTTSPFTQFSHACAYLCLTSLFASFYAISLQLTRNRSRAIFLFL